MSANNKGHIVEANGVHPAIRSFILKQFPPARKRALNDNDPLLESGIIDSLGVLDVVGFLERTFTLKIEDDELTPDNFGSIQQLASFVEQKRSQVVRQGCDLPV